MDERSYIERKQASWQRLSETLEKAGKHGIRSLSKQDLAALGAQYRAVVSDLSFARSQGASQELVGYLNELAGRAHGLIFSTPSARLRGIGPFLLSEFPALFRSTYLYTLTAAGVFFAGCAIAAFLILSGIVPRETWAPPEALDPATMSSFIMTNNIRVGMMAFAAGTTAGVLTVLVLFVNGLRIGAVASSLTGRAREAFWAFVPPHGIIELTAIFICGGAGLIIGSALIAPGNIRRADAMKLAAAKALRLFAGTLPFFVVAAIIEGFISPSAIPAWAKQVFAGLTAIALAFYLGVERGPE